MVCCADVLRKTGFAEKLSLLQMPPLFLLPHAIRSRALRAITWCTTLLLHRLLLSTSLAAMCCPRVLIVKVAALQKRCDGGRRCCPVPSNRSGKRSSDGSLVLSIAASPPDSLGRGERTGTTETCIRDLAQPQPRGRRRSRPPAGKLSQLS